MAGGDKVVMRAALLIVLAACTTPPRARTEPLGELVVAEAELVSSLRRGMAEGMTWRLAVRQGCADGTWRFARRRLVLVEHRRLRRARREGRFAHGVR